MARLFTCPYLGMPVELTEERLLHVASRHRHILIWDLEPVGLALADPDTVRRDLWSPTVLFFTRWYHRSTVGMHVVVVVANPGHGPTPWVISAYPTRRASRGGIVWQRN